MILLKTNRSLKALTASLLGSAALLTGPAFATTPSNSVKATTDQTVETRVDEEAARQLDDKRQQLFQRAIEAVAETDQALAALDEDNAEDALNALARATGELDIILAREPSLALAPIEVRTTRLETATTAEDVKYLRKEIRKLIYDGEFQEARLLMQSFGNEIRTRTTSLPLATYPEALKTAAAFIDDGDLDAARLALNTALGTFVIQETIAPLPLIKAQAMLDVAELHVTGEINEGVEDNLRLTEEQRLERAEMLREDASEQVELAKAYGYGDEDLYDSIEDDLDRMEDLIEEKRDTKGLFGSLSRQLEDLVNDDA